MRWGYSAGASWYAEEEAHTMLWCNEIFRLCFAARGGRRSSRGNIWHVKETVLSLSRIGKNKSIPPCTGTQAGSANLWVKHACVGIPHSDFVSSDQIGLMCVGESCWVELYYVSVFFFLHSHFSGCRHRGAASTGPFFFFFFYQIKF